MYESRFDRDEQVMHTKMVGMSKFISVTLVTRFCAALSHTTLCFQNSSLVVKTLQFQCFYGERHLLEDHILATQTTHANEQLYNIHISTPTSVIRIIFIYVNVTTLLCLFITRESPKWRTLFYKATILYQYLECS